jgi:hypothetical protein
MASEDVSSIELQYSSKSGQATIGFCALQAGEAVDLEKYVACAEPLWDPTLHLLAVLTGCATLDLLYADPVPDHNKPLHTPGYVEVSRAVDGVATRFSAWEGFWGFVHL